MTEETNTSGQTTWSGFLTRYKDPIIVVGAIVILIGTFWSGIVAGAAWFVDPKIDALRMELSQASGTTNAELSERIAAMESTLTETSGWLSRLHTQVTKNTEIISEVKGRGTPDYRSD